MENFTFAFNVVEAFVHNGANLMPWGSILIWLKGINFGGTQVAFLDEGWWNQQVAFIE